MKGFTLVELIVAMSVFLVSITLAVGVFVHGLRTQRLLTGEIAVNNSVNLVLEQMVRDIRTGYKFIVEDGGGSISFSGRGERSLKYSYDRSGEAVMLDLDGTEKRLTSENVRVENLKFVIPGFRGSCDPWRVTVMMAVKPKDALRDSPIHVQTTVSSRVLPADLLDAEFADCKSIILS